MSFLENVEVCNSTQQTRANIRYFAVILYNGFKGGGKPSSDKDDVRRYLSSKKGMISGLSFLHINSDQMAGIQKIGIIYF